MAETGFDVENPAATVTMTIVADLNEPAGLELVKAAMQLLVRLFPLGFWRTSFGG